MIKQISILLLLLFTIISNLKADELIWAADAESGAPYVFQDPEDPNNLIGFEVDIIEAIAKQLGKKPVHFQNQWDGLVPGLSRGDYVCAINGIEITEDRKLEVNFSDPYYLSYEQLIVRAETENITNLDDLKGKKCGTLKASLAERILVEHGGIDVRTYDSEVNSFYDLENGRLDAVLIDEPVAKYYAAWNPQLKLINTPIGEMKYGIVFNKKDTVLMEEVNKAIFRMISSGELREILDKWKLWNYHMAVFLNDKSESQTRPEEYERFIQQQKRGLTIWEYVDRYIGFMPMVGKAAWNTFKISVVSMLIAVFFGLFLAITRVFAPKPISMIAVAIIEVIRGTPLLLQLFFIYYGLPSLGIEIPRFAAAVLGLGINYAAYEAENYRAGILSVPRGQMEAAIALGMRRREALWHVILPQSIRLVIPPMTNDFISLLKDSSLVSIITLVELTKLFGQLTSTYYDYIGIGAIIGSVYLLMGLPFVKISKWAEEKLALEKRKILN